MTDTQGEAKEYYPTISGILVHHGMVLLVMSETLGVWVAPHTHIGLDETPIDALFRQIKSDTGLDREQLSNISSYDDNLSFDRDSEEGGCRVPFDIDIHRVGVKGHYHVDSSYVILSDTNTINPAGDQKVRWFSEEELEDLVVISRVTASRAKYALHLLDNS